MAQFVNHESSIVIAFSLLLLVSWGCHKKAAVVVPPPSPPVAAEETAPSAVTPRVPTPSTPAPLDPAPIPKTITAPSNLEVGEMNFHVGNYRQAARSFEAYLNSSPKSKSRDQALFYLGLSRILASDSSRDPHQAEVAFKRLITEFPTSPYRKEAEYILGLQAQIERLRSDVKERDDRIKRLSEELQKLKEIDLQRKPSRPQE
jgi:tetratricopeptide (TPR) repeat protein